MIDSTQGNKDIIWLLDHYFLRFVIINVINVYVKPNRKSFVVDIKLSICYWNCWFNFIKVFDQNVCVVFLELIPDVAELQSDGCYLFFLNLSSFF